MAVPPADDDGRALSERDGRGSVDEGGGTQGSDSARGRDGLRPILTVVLLVALVAAAATLGWLLWERRGTADDAQDRRDRVMAQAEQFLLRIGTFGPDLLEGQQMPEFREQVAQVLTPKAEAEFEEQVTVAEQLVAQQQAERSAEVYGTGVTELDEDSATALVAGSFTNSVAGEAGEPFPVYLRLDLVRVDGEWLVDGFEPAIQDEDAVAPETGQPPATSGQPTAEPTEEPAP